MSKRKRKSTPKMFNRAIMESDVSVSHDIVVCNGIDGFVPIKVDKLTLDGCIKRKYLTAINLRLDKKASIEVLAELSDLVRLLNLERERLSDTLLNLSIQRDSAVIEVKLFCVCLGGLFEDEELNCSIEETQRLRFSEVHEKYGSGSMFANTLPMGYLKYGLIHAIEEYKKLIEVAINNVVLIISNIKK